MSNVLEETEEVDTETDIGSKVELEGEAEFNPDNEDDILGGLDFDTTEQIKIPDRLIDQVIGQEDARRAVKKAANQGRHVLMIGSPGTGKSMLSKAMTEIMPDEELKDVIVRQNPENDNEPLVDQVPAGKGKQIIEHARKEVEKHSKMFQNTTYIG